MRNTMLAVAIVAASWAGAFGVALGVTEWRGDDATEGLVPSNTLCIEQAELFIQAAAEAPNLPPGLLAQFGVDMNEACQE